MRMAKSKRNRMINTYHNSFRFRKLPEFAKDKQLLHALWDQYVKGIEYMKDEKLAEDMIIQKEKSSNKSEDGK